MEGNYQKRYYKMDHKRRGKALILNHHQFEDKNLKDRSGTHVDCQRLHNVLKALGFSVEVQYDLTLRKINSTVKRISRMNHSNSDCLFIAVLTHGDPGKIYARNTHYKPEDLYRYFTDANCPTLAGKPKLFFFQACQGCKLDDGITLDIDIDVYQQDTSEDPIEAEDTVSTWFQSVKNPTHVDFLVAFSTVPGYYSWRNRSSGSWFVQVLCEELEYEVQKGGERDILNILTVVSQRVALNYASHVPERLDLHGKKQVPCINSMLLRLLVFEKKMENKCLCF